MQAGYVAEKALGYFQAAAGGVDAATQISSIVGATVMAKGPVLLIIQPAAQAVRFRDDGTAPTAAIGYPLAVGAELRYTARNMSALQVIAQTAGAVLNVWVYGHGGSE